MKGKIFIDTNIWLYSFMEQNYKKAEISRKLIEANFTKIILSTQVLNEICFNLIKKANYSEQDIKILIKNMIDNFHTTVVDEEIVLFASSLREKYKFSYWDSLIVSSALKNNCKILYTEDMHHGLIVDGVLEIVNPFKE